MLRLASQLISVPIGSLHAGYRVGTTAKPIINPSKLQVEAYYCEGPQIDTNSALLTKDIREFTPNGILIDHQEEISHVDELVRLQELIKINFELVDKKVTTEHGRSSLGKVTDYIVDDRDFRIQKLHVQRPIWRALANPQLVIGRNQIVKVTDDRVVVKDGVTKLTETKEAPVVNPDPKPL